MAAIIDGKALSIQVEQDLAKKVAEMKASLGRVPGLVVILVGEDPASQVYVRNKERACKRVGIRSTVRRLPSQTSQEELEALVQAYNEDPAIDGILIQLPLPKTMDERRVLSRVRPDKDVDGFHTTNAGHLFLGEESLRPCTPQGVMVMLESAGIDLCGKHAVVVGCSNIVGKPQAMMLLEKNATVTICHSRTKDLGAMTRQADVLVVAIGRAKMITADMIKPGAVVIDVGMNRLDDKLCGDVDYDGAAEIASAITPVPGGVGPMTIAMLMENTVKAAGTHG